MMHSMRRTRSLFCLLAVVGACSSTDTDPTALDVCGGTIAVRPGYRLLGTTKEDGVTLHYFGPVANATEPKTVGSLFTSTDRNIRLVEHIEQIGPEDFYLGTIESESDRACNGIVSLSVGESAVQTLLDVDGSPSLPWVAAINIGAVP